ncbi:hypothetical protein PHYSODRAFT_471498 [Phytophthora sojae]|uniref:RxLR effector protein n=1 Tax=Phytophthora sojae (strain P6497) TaxID=1094619 RepID=G4YMV2_PHYSP|nr:hypothetical protein PHYSODRAFT_471498 [Phytophthora sojae]EGZ29297.1 hypothetical protein PHYSODRAFT_471498 [Phytophthora sojae]|eukprot:XP_009516572.1 hypothetical protein PHYSODRAFT_471498 [Phytophthora sojae]
MLWRGFGPEKALKKLSVTSRNDKNFNKFVRYYSKYLAKYPDKSAGLPATAEDVVLLPKLTEWLGQTLRPSQVKQLLKDAGSTNVEKYLQLYRKDVDDALALPMLSKWKWVSKKLLPMEVAQKLKSAEVPDVSKYMGQYMEAGGSNVAVRTWLDDKILPQQLALKLKNAEVPDISKYMGQYMEAGGATLALEKYISLPKALYPQEVALRLQAAQVPDIKKYLKQYVKMWGKKQAEISRNIS